MVTRGEIIGGGDGENTWWGIKSALGERAPSDIWNC